MTMTRPRLIRGLRIAWNVVFGILCLLLIVLWVRSYWRYDLLSLPGPHRIASMEGEILYDEIFIDNAQKASARPFRFGC